jgi:hypothetical protein
MTLTELSDQPAHILNNNCVQSAAKRLRIELEHYNGPCPERVAYLEHCLGSWVEIIAAA